MEGVMYVSSKWLRKMVELAKEKEREEGLKSGDEIDAGDVKLPDNECSVRVRWDAPGGKYLDKGAAEHGQKT